LPNAELSHLLEQTACDTLELMFFAEILGAASPENFAGTNCVASALHFSGARSGSFGVIVQADAAQALAVDFLGGETEDPGAERVGEVICELANILCGGTLSRLLVDRGCSLSQPQLCSATVPIAEDAGTAVASIQLESGALTVWCKMDPAV
jgi:chemotaxis protein CheY-P-specific phosphatase CheC